MRNAELDPSDEGLQRAQLVEREMSAMEQHICVLQLSTLNMAGYGRPKM